MNLIVDNQLPILLVEDETLIRMGIALDLELAGIPVVEAGSADEAVSFLERGKLISAVITDIRMPGQIDGWGLVRWMREHRPHVPVIVTTGYQVDLAKDLPSVLAVLPKPYSSAVVSLLRASIS